MALEHNRTRTKADCSRQAGSGRSLPFWLAILFLNQIAGQTSAQFEGVSNTVHNLSVTGPGQIRSTSERQVCKFCHVPHNTEIPVPLWGHEVSRARYEVPSISTPKARVPTPQPDGSSRLCLSCHDGTVALGDVVGEDEVIPMAGGGRLGPGRPGFLGTDLSGSHPVSFEMTPSLAESVEASGNDMGLLPLEAIQLDPRVKLDEENKMQCTTCHDPHSDANFREGKVPRFWVKKTVDEVCLTCHTLR